MFPRSQGVLKTHAPLLVALEDEFEPNIIVSDIAMPERDGNELLREVRSR